MRLPYRTREAEPPARRTPSDGSAVTRRRLLGAAGLLAVAGATGTRARPARAPAGDPPAGRGRPAVTAGQAVPAVSNARQCGLAGDGVTNDQPALQALVDALGAAYAADGLGRVIYCPPGEYSIRDAGTVWRSGVSLVGAGPGVTRFLLSNSGNRADPTPLAFFTTLQHGATRANHLTDCAFERFEIDGSRVLLAGYNVLAKGLGMQYMLRARFRDLYIHDTAASGLGCDFLQDTTIESVVAERCGRLNPGTNIGGAGFGIGIGGWGPVERLAIADCTALGNGTNGFFVELQKSWWTPPRGIRVVGCHAEGNYYGISDWGADGMTVSACTMTANLVAGYDVSAHGTTRVGGRGGIVTDCVIDRNVHHGVVIGNTPGRYALRGNRISANGCHGYLQYNLRTGDRRPAALMALDGNEIWDNGLDGIRADAATVDAALVDNRIEGNGRRAAAAASGGGRTVSYTAMSMVDKNARWLPDGHLGKWLRVGDQRAVVTGNTATELTLAPWRTGATTAWPTGTPSAGDRYSLPAAPPARAGVTLARPTDRPTIRGNRIWDSRARKTQTYGLWVTDSGTCVSGWVADNDLAGNGRAAVRFDTVPDGGRWRDNVGLA
ncbi:right-handed parallel beta-helix repeat-containing protein [Planosporangium thailandense]|uniref:Right-handed parallel beta-helix repeat-containing protein n=1 Tax=Planosporangium thailandense TaxID=765197 RepID=A0ABX0XT92_9ACTN|nr:right-handed parallel beta-helix repeat-containing protein [Planosporangium thailandense]NJC68562.1 right-handed parallel beta-helix repeat-containing protein [Planosporangium thailandense]